ncbi:hypothetical protein [Streptomyces rubradiris]|uniref:Uncharacterized protein n=1 Tax=Streptomyces rubradiris TaxID=285531 RepID=A0ABQ3RAC4_STRRR|nr:hypothetical protein [Streptomyces rubradiris]GHH26003.1 hypothetical protein GCM10018792_65890 [Streptomyces rubradiris]GHI52794.1 hypothetical protein Srubr_26400 [Streptomyces rubradiris]
MLRSNGPGTLVAAVGPGAAGKNVFAAGARSVSVVCLDSLRERNPMSDDQEPTPAELRALMTEADALQRRILDISERLGASASEDVRRTRFRLEDAAGAVRTVRQDLDETAGDLARVRAVRDGRVCAVPWGVCPDHGNTLTGTGGRAWCTAPACTRRWGYDRLASPCGEPLTHRVADADGGSFLACTGHAMDASKRLVDGTVTPLGTEDGGRD